MTRVSTGAMTVAPEMETFVHGSTFENLKPEQKALLKNLFEKSNCPFTNLIFSSSEESSVIGEIRRRQSVQRDIGGRHKS